MIVKPPAAGAANVVERAVKLSRLADIEDPNRFDALFETVGIDLPDAGKGVFEGGQLGSSATSGSVSSRPHLRLAGDGDITPAAPGEEAIVGERHAAIVEPIGQAREVYVGWTAGADQPMLHSMLSRLTDTAASSQAFRRRVGLDQTIYTSDQEGRGSTFQ